MPSRYMDETKAMLDRLDPIERGSSITAHTTRDQFLEAFPNLWWCKDTDTLIVETDVDVFNEYQDDSMLRSIINDFNHARREWALDYTPSDDDPASEKLRAAFLAEIDRASRHTSEKNLADDIKALRKVSADALNSNPYLLGTPGGVYDLRDGTYLKDYSWMEGGDYDRETVLRQHVTKHTAADVLYGYGDLSEELDPKWLRFIDEITCHDADLADYLQRAFGYACFGGNPEEVMFVLYGPTTRNGKGVLTTAIKHALGDYAAQVTPNFLLEKKSDATVTDAELASLVGRRVVFAQEPPKDGKFDESRLKALTGGDPVLTARKYGHPFTYVPEFTIFMACNDLPRMEDNSVFLSKRLVVIPFNRHFDEDEQDKTLKHYFTSNRYAIESILKWLTYGYLTYMERGLEQPKAIITANERYRVEQQTSLERFLYMCADYDVKERWDKKDFVKKYELFCANLNLDVLTSTKRNRALKSLGCDVQRSHGTDYYRGVCEKAISMDWDEIERGLEATREAENRDPEESKNAPESKFRRVELSDDDDWLD